MMPRRASSCTTIGSPPTAADSDGSVAAGSGKIHIRGVHLVLNRVNLFDVDPRDQIEVFFVGVTGAGAHAAIAQRPIDAVRAFALVGSFGPFGTWRGRADR